MPITSYDLTNKVRDVSAALDYLRTGQPTLFSLARIGANVKNRTAEWVDKYLGIKYVDVSNVSGMVLTVPDGSIFAVGMELSPIASADNFVVASVSVNEVTVTKADESMGDPTTGRYEISNGGVLETAVTGPEAHWSGKTSLNYVQIFRQDASLTALAIGSDTYDAQNEMATQEAAALTQLYHDINKNIWKGYKKLGNNAEAGRMGGLYQMCSALQVDGGGKALTKAVIDSALKLLADNGGKPDYLVCNRSQIAAINAIYENQIILTQEDPVRGTYVSKIRNPYAPDGILNVIIDDVCPVKDIWLIESSKIEFDFHENMPLIVKDTTQPGSMGMSRSITCAGTVKFHNAGQCFASIRNLK